MYKIFANNSIIFDDVAPLQSLKLIEPRLTLEENAAGSLEFTVPPDHVAYNSLACMTTELIVTQDDVEIWRGRIISEEVNFWKCKKYVAEGELAYLNDSIQPPKKYVTGNTSESGAVGNTTVRSFLIALLNQHNSQVGSAAKQFTIGGVTVEDGDTVDDSNAINRFTNYETTLACINEKLIQKLGGHLRIRHQNGVRYLDYYKDYSQTGASDQVIRFGSNLLDYVSNLESVDWVTAIVPRGKRLEIDESEQPVKGLEAYTNVTGVATDGNWHTNGSMFVKYQDKVNLYGFISAVVDWDQVTDPVTLKNKAKKYLQEYWVRVFDQLCLEISAVDLHYLNPEIETLKLQEEVTCISDVHDMNARFPITKIEIDLINPSNTKYTLGTKVSTTLTNAQNRANSELASYVEDTFIPVESKVLQSAKANAKALIEGTADGGYASFIFGTDANGNAIIDPNTGKLKNPDRPTGIRVANAVLDSNATNRWLWTYGGLGHQTKSGTTWQSPNVAMTMDGKIVADFITTGCISLTGASTQSSSKASPAAKSFLKVFNTNGTKIGHWGSDGIWIGSGSIQIGTKDSSGRYPFYVDTNGNLELTSWTDNNKTTVRNRWTSSSIYISAGTITLGTPNDANGTGCSISSTGQLIAKNANIKGNITVTGGSISIITDNAKKFEVSSAGVLTAMGATISGNITATTGYVGYWKIADGIMTNTTDGSSAILSYNKIGAGKAGYGVVILRGSTRDDGNINSGGDSDYSTDKRYGFIQISNTGDPDECRGGIRIYGNGHIVWFDDHGNAYDDRYLRNIDEG